MQAGGARALRDAINAVERREPARLSVIDVFPFSLLWRAEPKVHVERPTEAAPDLLQMRRREMKTASKARGCGNASAAIAPATPTCDAITRRCAAPLTPLIAATEGGLEGV